MAKRNPADRLRLDDRPTADEIQYVKNRLCEENQQATGGLFDQEVPAFTFDLAVRAPDGSVAGGINVSTLLGVMWLEVLWVSEEHRRRGLGSWLVLEAERIAHDRGCVGAGTWTFSWQGADFYPTIGYRLNGVYEGYPLGMTEHVLSKRLPDDASHARIADVIKRKSGYTLVQDPTKEDMRIVHLGLHEYCAEHAGEGRDNLGIDVRLVLRDGNEEVVGGLIASTVIRVVVLERLWIDAAFRRQGHGRALLERMEQIARDYGCVGVQGSCFSFQGPEFFCRRGYESFGHVDVYRDGHVEHLLIKRLRASGG